MVRLLEFRANLVHYSSQVLPFCVLPSWEAGEEITGK